MSADRRNCHSHVLSVNKAIESRDKTGEGGRRGGGRERERGGGEKASSRPITGDCGLTSGVTPVKSGDTYVRHWPVSRSEAAWSTVCVCGTVVGTGQFGQFSGLICLFTFSG